MMRTSSLLRYVAELAREKTADDLFEAARDYFSMLSWLTATAFLMTVASVALRCDFFLAPLATLPVIFGYILIIFAFISNFFSQMRKDRSSRKYLNFVLPLVMTMCFGALWLFSAYGWSLGGVVATNVCAYSVG
ncbi:MAG: hypothetical protein AAFQ84_13665 [Pseudomonadota bacterium]